MSSVTPENRPEVRIHDATVNIWCEDPFSEQVKSIFKAVKALLNRRGFSLGPDPVVHHRILVKTHRAGKAGDLEVAASLSGRHIEVQFFQNVHQVQNPNGGRYDFDKLARMPFLLRKRAQLEMNKVRELLVSKFGASVTKGDVPLPHPNRSTAVEFIEARNRGSGHFKAELGHADWYADYNRQTGDRQLLTHGTPVYFRDRKGRWACGVAYYNLNNMWWVAVGKYEVRNLCSTDLFVRPPLNVRLKANLALSIKRVATLIKEAVAAEDFLRAQQLKLVRDRLQAQEAAAVAAPELAEA